MPRRDIAILVAKYFAIDIDRQSQSSFAIFSGQKKHRDARIIEIQQYIESHYDEKLTVDVLADQAVMSRRSFERRFKKATGNTVIEYLQKVKIEAAKRRFEAGGKSIGEVMEAVGYSDPTAFRKVFKRISGLSPLEYKNRYAHFYQSVS